MGDAARRGASSPPLNIRFRRRKHSCMIITGIFWKPVEAHIGSDHTYSSSILDGCMASNIELSRSRTACRCGGGQDLEKVHAYASLIPQHRGGRFKPRPPPSMFTNSFPATIQTPILPKSFRDTWRSHPIRSCNTTPNALLRIPHCSSLGRVFICGLASNRLHGIPSKMKPSTWRR